MASENPAFDKEKKAITEKAGLDDNISITKVKSVAEGEVISLDAAEVFLREHNFHDDYLAELLADEPMNKRLVRKIDFVVLPLLAGTYVLQASKKVTL